MNIFFSGIGGVALGPLAQIAHDAGHTVLGSDAQESLTTRELSKTGISVTIGQSAELIEAEHAINPIDWFVYTAALPNDHPEFARARELGIKTTKRDELLAHILEEKNMKLIAISGTHGKTTTTGMMVWALQQLGIPVSYSIGSTISFGPSGAYDAASEYFVYECDEFDKNFLHFSPYVSVITSIGYDHSDTYPTKDDYRSSFSQFIHQSAHTIAWNRDTKNLPTLPAIKVWQLQENEVASLEIPGEHNRRNATLVLKALEYLGLANDPDILTSFPGTNRRFEKLTNNLYSDYGHHPTEIAATLQLASELSDHVVLVYQPHQNIRQYEIRADYTNAFLSAEKVYWLPTYLSREDASLPVLTPAELIASVSNKDIVTVSELSDELLTAINLHRSSGDLVLCMGAGSIDEWIRSRLN